MRIELKDDSFIIYLHQNIIKINNFNQDLLEEYIKELILKIKKTFKIKISGSYIVNIYENRRFGLILEFSKQDNLDFFPDLIDLKLNLNKNSEVYVKVNDYFLLSKYQDTYYFKDNFYIDINQLLKKDEIYLSDFGKYIYGKELTDLKKKLMLVKR